MTGIILISAKKEFGAALWAHRFSSRQQSLNFRLSHDCNYRQGKLYMFESAPVNPPDAIFGLIEEFKRDQNPDKINLTVGMYQDDAGTTPVVQCVQEAKRRILELGRSHVYLPIDGLSDYNRLIPQLIFGDSYPATGENRVHSLQTPGGTGALRVAGEMLRARFGVEKIWISKPTWSNHMNIFAAAGLEIMPYQYLDERGTSFDFDGCIEAISKANPKDAILLHTVCHNPTGVDPNRDQWLRILAEIDAKKLIPIFDFAYQGFDQGVEEDAFPIRHYCDAPGSAIICSSFSKNFNLYGERVGAITVVGPNADDAAAVHSQAKAVIRSIYSNPPTFGGQVVATVFEDDALAAQWRVELESFRTRICDLRSRFVAAANEQMPDQNFEHILNQRGMFSYSGIDADSVERLKNEYSIYLLKSGRINVAGINANNLERLCSSLAAVLA